MHKMRTADTTTTVEDRHNITPHHTTPTMSCRWVASGLKLLALVLTCQVSAQMTTSTPPAQTSALTTTLEPAGSGTESNVDSSTGELTTTMLSDSDSLNVGAIVFPVVAIMVCLFLIVVAGVLVVLWKKKERRNSENELVFDDERSSREVSATEQEKQLAIPVFDMVSVLEPSIKPHFHEVSRQDAEKLLEGCPPGSFVITPRSSAIDPDDGAVVARTIITYVCPSRLDVHHVGLSFHTVNATYTTLVRGKNSPPTRSLVRLLRQARLNVDISVRDHYAKISSIQSSQQSHYDELTAIEVGEPPAAASAREREIEQRD